jgi:two-component system, NarL family, sensor histidine kinase LiaS
MYTDHNKYEKLHKVNLRTLLEEMKNLMYSQVVRNFKILKEQTPVVNIMLVYRYLSLFITSLFYIVSTPSHLWERKAIVITCISISSLILQYLYIKNLEYKSNILFLIFVETLGNSCVLIPSGGINSPYIWYSLNTILIASLILERKYCWISLFTYIIASTCITYKVFNDKGLRFYEHIANETNLILSFILIAFMVQLISKYMMAVQEESRKLSQANVKIKEAMSYTKEIYQAVHLLSTYENKANLIELIIKHTKNIIKTDTVIFYCLDKDNSLVLCSEENEGNDFKEKAVQELTNLYKDIIKSGQVIDAFICEKRFIISTVKSGYLPYGIIGVEVKGGLKQSCYDEVFEQLKLLAELSAMAMERYEIEQVNERLVISEEQNRIANEIHDSVLQRLFSISCGIFAVNKNLSRISAPKLQEELNLMRDSINTAMNELRSAVYGLSWKKEGTNNFTVDLLNYINEIRRMNKVNISFDMIGESELLSLIQKKSLYRIICEGVSNAVRHGKARNIDITLKLENESTTLELIDDGNGFDMNSIRESNLQGLGLQNMRNLMCALDGQVTVDSKLNQGTKVYATFPMKREVKALNGL